MATKIPVRRHKTKHSVGGSRSQRAGLHMPVARIHRALRQGRYVQRLSAGTAVYLAAVLEYMAAEVWELAGAVAREHKAKRITPRHIKLAVSNDEELHNMMSHIVVPGGGVDPFVHAALVPKKRNSKK